MADQIKGVFCAAATPIGEDGAPDLGRMARHAGQLISDGCDGVALLGTTGEANSFSVAERQQIVEAAVEAGIPPDRLMPGTGTCAIPDTVALTRHALSLGVTNVRDAAAVLLQAAERRRPLRRLQRGHRESGRPAAQGHPLSLPPDVEHSARPAAHRAARFALSGNGRGDQGFVRRCRQHGTDGARAARVLGFRRGRSADAAAAGDRRRRLHHGDVQSGRRGSSRPCSATMPILAARQRWTRRRNASSEMRAVAAKFVQIPAIKAMLARRYEDAAWARVRPPLMALDAAQLAELERLMSEAG